MEFRVNPKALQNRGGVNIRIVEKALEQVSEYKYLGTLFNEKLSGIAQYNKLVGTMASKICTLAKVRYLMDTKTTILLYKTTILSIFDYKNWNHCRPERSELYLIMGNTMLKN